jgi:Fe-S oxidoreductase
MAIHDACATRHDNGVQDSVRHLLEKLGVQVTELEDNRSLTTCCGYGGLMSFGNPEVAEKVINRRVTRKRSRLSDLLRHVPGQLCGQRQALLPFAGSYLRR